MPLYEFMLEQSYAGQQIVNRWNYISDAVPAGQLGALLGLAGMGFTPLGATPAFGSETIAGILKAIQSSGATWVQAVAKNIYDPTDYYAYAFPAGTVSNLSSSDQMSPVVAIGMSTDRTRSDIRRGQKRFAGILEGFLEGQGYLSSATVTAWQGLADAMADINVVPSGESAMTFTPYVFGRKKTVDVDGKISYPYWPTAEEQTAHAMRINAWTVKNTMRTQGTRQFGRGA